MSCAFLLTACEPPGGDEEGSETEGPNTPYNDPEGCENGISLANFDGENLVPVEGCWTKVADASFDPETINRLRIGGPLDGDNYANRGDVELHYTFDANRIVVEIKPFTYAMNEEDALLDFERLEPWMYARESVAPPFEISQEEFCDLEGAWQDGCNVRVWYNGQVQKLRIGAHIRVFVPRGWEGEATLATEDNLAEPEEYPARSSLRVIDAPGSAELTLDGGAAYVRLDRATEPVPKCTEEQNAACAELGWDQMAPECLACTDFGRAHITSRGPANMVVDAPSDLWIIANLENTQEGLGPSNNPGCESLIDCEAFGGCEWLENEPSTPWKRRAALNQPANALEGLGYNIRMESNGCASTMGAETPLDEPAPTLRGSLELCSGCLEDVESPDPDALF